MTAQPKPDTSVATVAGRAERQRGREPSVSGVTPSQRAAVIIAVLGESAAKPIVEKLDDVALAKVVDALESISLLTREQLVEIVIDFLTHLRKSSGALRGGRSKAREVISGILEPGRLSIVLGEEPSEAAGEPVADGDVWSRFAQKEPRAIARYLSGLTPNIMALILRRLDVSTSSEVLCHLDDDKMVPMMGYLVETDKLDPGIDSVIARMVEMEFLNVEQEPATENETHLETIGELLSLIPDEKRESLVSFLQSEHEAKLRSIEKGLLTIEGLPDLLPRNAVPVLFREVDTATMVQLLGSLQQSHPAVADYLLSNISSRMATQIRDDLVDFQPLPAAEVEGLKRDLLTSIMGLRQRGLITLERPTADEG